MTMEMPETLQLSLVEIEALQRTISAKVGLFPLELPEDDALLKQAYEKLKKQREFLLYTESR